MVFQQRRGWIGDDAFWLLRIDFHCGVSEGALAVCLWVACGQSAVMVGAFVYTYMHL